MGPEEPTDELLLQLEQERGAEEEAGERKLREKKKTHPQEDARWRVWQKLWQASTSSLTKRENLDPTRVPLTRKHVRGALSAHEQIYMKKRNKPSQPPRMDF